jgi:hypothetical protein
MDWKKLKAFSGLMKITQSSINIIMSETTPEPILCYACTDVVTEFHEKSISGYSYYYCCQECVDFDFTTCSSCGEAEVSKNDCTDGSYGCCMRYLGGNPQYYCSDRCEGEDVDEFIRSFRKN